MKYKKKRKSFVSLVCVLLLLLSVIELPVGAADTNRVTASTATSVKQGNYGYCYVSIDSTEELAALEVSVYFDPAKVKIVSAYNQISCTMYDSAVNVDNVRFSYLLDGKGEVSKTSLFYFRYQVLSNAEVGTACFDITIGEAYDKDLQDVAVSGSGCGFTITESVTNKSCSVYGTSSVSTAVQQEFTLDYTIYDYEIASGTVVITYDSELFEVVEAKAGRYLKDKVVDINTELKGEIYLSFVGTERATNSQFFSVTFRTIQNADTTSQIVLKTPELLDKDLNAISCNGYTSRVTIAYDKTYVGDAPVMRVDAAYNKDTSQVTAEIRLEKDSNLGAGDFTLEFDAKVLQVASYEKGFAPDYFHINAGEAEEGRLKFSIISLENIMSAETVLTVVFDVQLADTAQDVALRINGSMLSDALTNPILLNFVQDSVTLPAANAEIIRKGQTLEYKNMIFVKVIFELSHVDLSKVNLQSDAGMLCWTEEEFHALESVAFEEEHALVGLEPYSGTDYYYGKSEGIYTRYLAEELYYVGYVKLADGTYIYSEPKLYGPTTYAYSMLSKDSTSQKTKELCVALLNYIADAQRYFYSDISEAELANAGLSEEQKKLEWNLQMSDFHLGEEVPDDKQVERDTTVFRRVGKNLRFQEMISMISVYQMDDAYVETAEECGTIYWTAEEFAALSRKPGIDNYGNGQKVRLETYGATNTWCSVAPAVAAKDMTDTCYYILGYVKHSDGTISYSGVDSYSFEQYIYNTTVSTTASQEMITFAKRLYFYERAANTALK